jgi:phosphoribosylaminoimidazole-succinocarboxamide synthase
MSTPSAITATDLKILQLKSFYKGKVRDVYYLDDKRMIMVATDRISAFDVVLPRGITYKGQVLNQLAAYFLNHTRDIIPNWLDSTPHPMVSIGTTCEPVKIEMVVRAYLAGHALREYQAGKRILCGVPMPDGLRPYEKLPSPIITPTTKASEGHDEDIDAESIIENGLATKELWNELREASLKLFERGTEMAAKRGLILADTKYEFGIYNDRLMLMDEIHTPDSSRYFYQEGFDDLVNKGETPRQLSKEFVREWLMANGFQGKDGQSVPEMTNEKIEEISNRYIELYEWLIGESFNPNPELYSHDAIQEAVNTALA